MRYLYRCASCGRPITIGHEKRLNGEPYGSLCFDRALSRLEFEAQQRKSTKSTQIKKTT